MRRIVLARHGRPEWSDTTLITGREAKGFAASPLRRSLESLHLLAPDAIPFVDPVFREVDVPRSVPLPLPLPGQMYSRSPGSPGSPDGRRRWRASPRRGPGPARRRKP